ncbi:hypothetical protein [Fodinibius halophilus]|uniref:Uncharacterized protein n=1 Tax=Fodinibius halophilus TaxID=1736908 RepID=A0A6M1TMN7_9BACT|nr:hypothetical protein [Fodinibius halophilus]NGP89650.1 hypothetical protein [Fodinibius halophilus]
MRFGIFNSLNVYLMLLAVGLLLVTACNQGTDPELQPEEPNERLAYALAAALDNPEVREIVHSAMDASPYHEHKLIFGEFLQHEEGALLKNELVKKLGSEKELKQLLQELPTLDFYLPYETHRETWEHANDNLMAVCVTEVHAEEATAYHPDGSSRTLNSKEQIHQAEVAAMFTLHPAEPKIQRSASSVKNNVAMSTNRWRTRAKKIWNWTDDGLFGGDCEIYFMTSSTKSEKEYRSKIMHVPSNPFGSDTPKVKVLSTEVWIHPDAAVKSEEWLNVHVLESDGPEQFGDDSEGFFTVKEEGVYATGKRDSDSDLSNPTVKAKIVVR